MGWLNDAQERALKHKTLFWVHLRLRRLWAVMVPKRSNRSSHSPHFQNDEFGMPFSIPQEDRLLKPLVLSIRRVEAGRRSEVVLAGGNRLAGCDAIQHILCAMADSRIAHLDPDRVHRLNHIM